MFRIICMCIGYAVGMIQTAFIIGKAVAKIDIRDYGSGNAGATNAVRVLGPKAGIAVFVCDLIKGVLAYVLCSLIFPAGSTEGAGFLSLPGVYGGLGAILGHCYPFYLKFKGGKGVAATLGVMMCLDIKAALIAYVCGISIVVLSRYISLASLSVTAAYLVLLLMFRHGAEVVVIWAAIAGLIWYAHRGNIVRLINGKENKFNFKKQVQHGKNIKK